MELLLMLAELCFYLFVAIFEAFTLAISAVVSILTSLAGVCGPGGPQRRCRLRR